MDIATVSSFAVQALIVVAGLAWGVRQVTRQRSYREICRARLRDAMA